MIFDDILLTFLWGNNTLMGFPVLKHGKTFPILEKNNYYKRRLILSSEHNYRKKWILFVSTLRKQLEYFFMHNYSGLRTTKPYFFTHLAASHLGFRRSGKLKNGYFLRSSEFEP